MWKLAMALWPVRYLCGFLCKGIAHNVYKHSNMWNESWAFLECWTNYLPTSVAPSVPKKRKIGFKRVIFKIHNHMCSHIQLAGTLQPTTMWTPTSENLGVFFFPLTELDLLVPKCLYLLVDVIFFRSPSSFYMCSLSEKYIPISITLQSVSQYIIPNKNYSKIKRIYSSFGPKYIEGLNGFSICNKIRNQYPC